MSKGPSDTQRLLRAFKVPPTNKKMSLIVGGGLTVISALGGAVAIVPAAALLGGLGVFEYTDRRAIRKGLRELDEWGIPIEGYREFLLAEEPSFDVELRRHADANVISTSTRAVDPGIRVRRIGDREVRFVTRRMAMPGLKDGDPPVYMGDRNLLFEVYERILAPLHADVGIARIRMGERATLETRPSEPVAEEDQPVVEGMGAFRDQAMAAPPALQALVHTKSTLALAEDVRSLRNRSERVLYATGRSPHGIGAILGITAGVGLMGIAYGPIGWIIAGSTGLITGTSLVVGNNRRNAHRADSELFADFPVEDYDAWLLSGRPIFDIELRSDATDRASLSTRLRSIEAWSGEKQESVKWVEDVTWLEDNIVRVETRPTLITPSTSRIRPFYGGSHELFKRLVLEVLVPLHREIGIVSVRMGGYVNRRV